MNPKKNQKQADGEEKRRFEKHVAKWQRSVKLGPLGDVNGIENDIHPFPTKYFKYIVAVAVRVARNACTVRAERDSFVVNVLTDAERDYKRLVAMAFAYMRQHLAMGYYESDEMQEVISEAVCEALEERYFAFVHAAGTIRPFRDVLWPAILRRVCARYPIHYEPVDERRLVKWLLELLESKEGQK